MNIPTAAEFARMSVEQVDAYVAGLDRSLCLYDRQQIVRNLREGSASNEQEIKALKRWAAHKLKVMK